MPRIIRPTGRVDKSERSRRHGAGLHGEAMSEQSRNALDRELDSFASRLPDALARWVHWLRRPSSRYVRIPASIGLVLGGVFSFLPIFGLWMLPLGLVLIAKDVPVLQRPVSRMLFWINRKLPQRQPDTPRDTGSSGGKTPAP